MTKAQINIQKLLPYILCIPTIQFTYAIYLYDRSLVNYGFIVLAFVFLWFIKTRNKHFEESQNNYTITFDDNKIILKKGSRIFKEFQISSCALIIINTNSFLKIQKIIIQNERKLYYLGAFEKTAALLSEARKINLKIKVKNQKLILEMLTILLICTAAISDMYNYVQISVSAGILALFFTLIILYRFFTKFYSKAYVISKENESWLKFTQISTLSWGLCCILSIFAYTDRDQSLEALKTTLGKLDLEHSNENIEKQILIFNKDLVKFKTDYPGDLAGKLATKKIEKIIKRKIASEKD